jgi:hypothetical protein
MSENHNIEIIIEGLDKEGGDTQLDTFIKQLSHIDSALKKIEKDLSNGKNTTHFRVVDLTHSSPAKIVLGAYTNPNQADFRDAILIKMASGLAMLKKGETPSDLGMDVLEDLKKISDKIGKTVKSTTINICNKAFDFSGKVAETLAISLSSIESCFTSYEGQLEQINIHNKTNVFYIYPPSGPPKIKCSFNANLYDRAVDAIGRKVLVEGVAKYRALTNFPFEIDVNDIEVYPIDDELPTFEDLRGIAPNATGDKLSEEYIADLRDEWL